MSRSGSLTTLKTTPLVLFVLLAGCVGTERSYYIHEADRLDSYVRNTPNRPTVIVDLDDTVVDGGPWNSFLLLIDLGYRGIEPFPRAAETLTRVAKRWNVVFITARPDLVADATSEWLAEHGFPRAPVVLSTAMLLTDRGKADYKTDAIAAVRAAGLDVVAGVGDKSTDMAAYEQHGLLPYLLLEAPDDPDGAHTEHIDRLALVTKSWNSAWLRIGASLARVHARLTAVRETIRGTDRASPLAPSP